MFFFFFNPCNFPVKILIPIHRGEMRLGGLMCMDMSIASEVWVNLLIEGMLVGKMIGSYKINQYYCIFSGTNDQGEVYIVLFNVTVYKMLNSEIINSPLSSV